MNELVISLDSGSREPLYEQIYNHIKKEIQERQMAPGERLPSSRMLSRYLQISRSTVDLAYGQLLSEGYIESIPCKGYYVCQIEELCQLGFTDFASVPGRQGIREKTGQQKYRYDFALNGIDPEGFPQNTWRKISKMVLQENNASLFALGNPQGEEGLREAIANYLHHARGVRCAPEQIIVGAGNDYLLMLLHVIWGKKKKIAMEQHTYKSAFQCFENLGDEICHVGMDAQGIRVEELLETGADIAYVMPSHQFPTGVIMPLQRRMQLLSWAAQEENRYIIEDDYDSEFRYRGKPIPALQGFDTMSRVIYLGTFSKSLAPSIRISYMVLPWSLTEQYQKRGSNFSATVSRVDQKMIEIFLRDGHFERHLNKMRGVYKGKHDLMLSCLREMEPVCRVYGENAGLHLQVRFADEQKAARAKKLAAQEGIRVYEMNDYSIANDSKTGRDSLLLGYAALTETEIVNAMESLKKSWKNL